MNNIIPTREAFVYCWVDLGTSKLYLGAHKGSPDDGYVCSSKPMLKEHVKRPNDFFRYIIYCGSWRNMLVLEQKLIEKFGAAKNPSFYNQSCNVGPYHADRSGAHHTPETKAKLHEYWMVPEHRIQSSTRRKGIKHSPEWVEANRRGHIGAILKAQHRENISKGMKLVALHKKGIPQKRTQCPHCGNIGGYLVMNRHHFDNCKKRIR